MNIPGVYVAGDVIRGFKQIATVSERGSEAALTILENLIVPDWKK